MPFRNLIVSFLSAACMLILYSCSQNNVKIRDDWGKYFKDNKVEGCFMLFDNGNGRFQVYNLPRTQERFLPASTFKIMNSLVGLETGIISDTSMVIKWDSITRPVAAWNKDLTMGEAFRASAVPYYQEVARRIGRPVMQMWLDSIKYGNMKMGSRVDSFWLDNSLKISPDEELGLVKRLYFSKLPFQDRSQRLVRGVMLTENNPKYQLSYKTGWGSDSSVQIAWITGWEVENNHPYFFVLNFQTPDPSADIPAIRMNIVKGILQSEGFFEGKK